MGNTLKNFFKTIRRYQSRVKISLLFLLVLVLICAGSILYFRHRAQDLNSQISDTGLQTEVPILEQVTPSATPSVMPSSKPSVKPSAGLSGQEKNYGTTSGSGVKNMKKGGVVTQKSHIYLVRKGDSLWKISATQYKTPQKWTTIYRANHRTIGSNPNLIYPKTQLRIPAIRR